jgi:hypothetical protein
MCILGHKDGIVTLEDWFKYRAAIVNYLCQNWLVITDKDFDRTHSERLTENDYHPHWKEAVFAFKRAYGESCEHVEKLKKSIKRECVDMVDQMVGCLQSALVKSDVLIDRTDPSWALDVAFAGFGMILKKLCNDPKGFWKRWAEKELLQEASIPSECLSDLVPVAIREACVTHNKPFVDWSRCYLPAPSAPAPLPVQIS